MGSRPAEALKPGLYRLTRDVTNPAPDRRSKEFAKLPIWRKGTRLVAVFRRPDYIPGVPEDGGVDMVYLFGGYEHLGVSWKRPGFDELIAAMALEPRSLDSVLRNDPHLRGVLRRLLAAGKITLDDIEAAL